MNENKDKNELSITARLLKTYLETGSVFKSLPKKYEFQCQHKGFDKIYYSYSEVERQ